MYVTRIMVKSYRGVLLTIHDKVSEKVRSFNMNFFGCGIRCPLCPRGAGTSTGQHNS